ncbi:hypothetical protein GW916_01805 [bacterium]|nr:hypothetical protein [bacterium]
MKRLTKYIEDLLDNIKTQRPLDFLQDLSIVFRSLLPLLLLSLNLSGCLASGGSDQGFGDLVGGSLDDVEELTINSTLPDVSSLIVEQGNFQDFFVSAKAPGVNAITYQWTDGSTLVSTAASYRITASASNIGSRTLTVTVSDGITTKTKAWSIKVNGPPTLTPVTTGTPKVAVGSSLSIQATASDPNGDNLTYTWKLNGVTSPYLVGSGATATLTGNNSIVGSINISATVSDGSATASHTWTAEVNHFPQACNTLTTGKICTYAGSPSLGNGVNPLNSTYDLKISPIAQTQDTIGNLFIADNANNLIWYWNKTSSAVTRLGVSIPANTIKVVAGSGESAVGADGVALESGIYSPRGLYYDNSTGRLFISEYSSHRVRYVDTNGYIYTGVGGGTSHVDGVTAYSHRCRNPAGLAYGSGSLYIACRTENRVKRWDLATDMAYTVYGSGSGSWSGLGSAAPASVGAPYPYNITMTTQGFYVSHRENHRIVFVNTSASSRSFWTSTSNVTVASNRAQAIIGTGSAGYEDDKNPNVGKVGNPADVVEVGSTLYFIIQYSNRDRIYAANNSGSTISISGISIGAGKMKNISSALTASYNGSNIPISQARVNEPYAMSLDVLDGNNVYFSDYNNRRLRRFNVSDQKLYDVIGSGKSRNGNYGDTPKPTLSHLFNYPAGLAYETSTRYLFFSDSSNCKLRQVNPFGVIQTAVGSTGCAAPTLDNEIASSAALNFGFNMTNNRLNGLTLLPNSNLVIANSNAYNVRLWNRTTSSATYFNTYIQNDRVSNIAGDYLNTGNGGNGPATAVPLSRPNGTAYDSSTGDLFVIDRQNHCIRKVDSSGNMTTALGTCGTSGNSGNSVAAGSVLMNLPTKIVLDSAKNMYITDSENSKIRYWNRSSGTAQIGSISVPANTVSTVACLNGTSGSNSENILATSARCYRPSGITVNGSQFCFSNTYYHNVRCVNLTGSNVGRVNTVAGYPMSQVRAGSPYGFEQEGISGTSATLYYPTDVIFDGSGDLFIADTYNHIVRKLKLSSP